MKNLILTISGWILKQRIFWGLAMGLLMITAWLGLPPLAAGILLYPYKRSVGAIPPVCEKITFAGDGVTLYGWRGKSVGKRRATIIYLHGVSDNRVSGAGVIERFCKRGFDVVAYDSRAHGESSGDACTYGFFEKKDLKKVLDQVEPGPIILLGSSLGGAVALQLAAVDERVTAVIGAEIFSDLRTVAYERAPFFLSSGMTERALKIAEEKGRFQVDAVSPVSAARSIKVPVLLIHGAADTDTPPAHSRRIYAALAGPKKLILMPNARHNESLQGPVWEEIENWVDRLLAFHEI